MLTQIATELFTKFKHVLNDDYEHGGYVDVKNDSIVVVDNPSGALTKDGQLFYVWRDHYEYTWHSHPGLRRYKYEPPSGFDIQSALQMSAERNDTVTGFALETKGVWCYRVKAPKNWESNLDLTMWLASNWAARLSGDPNAVKDYDDEEDRQPLPDVDSYIQRWLVNENNTGVQVIFFAFSESGVPECYVG